MKKWMKWALLLGAGMIGGASGCGAAGFTTIPPAEAKAMMDRGGVVIVDVREPEEYREGHVPGARLLSLGTIDADTAARVIPSKDSEVLVYCRSGVRSKKGAAKLAALGYRRIYDFGGILQWPYEVEK